MAKPPSLFLSVPEACGLCSFLHVSLEKTREGFSEEEHSTLAGKDWSIGAGFLEERMQS